MSEWGESKPSRDPGWATAGSNQTDPGSAKRAAGYGNNTTLPSEEHNWLQATQGLHLDWLARVVERRFDSVSEALGAVELGDIFRVAPGGSGVKRLGELEELVTTSATLMATDGERVYTVESGNRLYSRRPHLSMSADPSWGPYSGFLTWSSGIDQIACDGAFVFVGRDGSYLSGKLAVFRRSDGDLEGEISWPAGGGTVGPMASNGSRWVGVVGTNLEFRDSSDLASPGISDYAHGANINDVAIDQDRSYVVGNPSVGGVNPGATVFALDNETGAVLWSQAITSGGAYPRAVACDGEYVYICVDDDVRCLCRLNGSQAWSVNIGGTPARLAIDDRYLYASYDGTSTPKVWVIDKARGWPVAEVSDATITTFGSTSADMLGIYTLAVVSGAAKLVRVWSGAPSQRLMAAHGEDPHRRFYKRAIPAE